MALKKKLGEAKGQWADLVPEVLWSYNTTIHSATGETPFKIVYGTEAMIPVEITTPTIRAEHHTQTSNNQARATELDTIEEVRNNASLKQKALQQLTQRQYNKNVIPRAFQAGDLVLRKTEEARRTQGHGKLAAAWDGLYRVDKVLGMGAYTLQTLRGSTIPGTWNVSSLKLYIS
ncbi:uncharacterized protein [Arachis hypogaea]|uniref:uncharacterized protein n=1 Tax=Arachis hypogaea TaxID=3818 RepID=UPI003B222C8F